MKDNNATLEITPYLATRIEEYQTFDKQLDEIFERFKLGERTEHAEVERTQNAHTRAAHLLAMTISSEFEKQLQNCKS